MLGGGGLGVGCGEFQQGNEHGQPEAVQQTHEEAQRQDDKHSVAHSPVEINEVRDVVFEQRAEGVADQAGHWWA